jgi:hypothetical protein
MTYSPHTFQLTLELGSKKFISLRDIAYKKSKGSHRIISDSSSDEVIDTAYKNEGITIKYCNSTYKKKIKMIVNPSRTLGGDDLKLWKPNNENISRLIESLETIIDDYFDSGYELNDFKLSRIDFTVNINVGSRENVSAYIKVLNNIGKVKGFSPKYPKNDKRINKELSFDLEGNSNGVDFTAYDKESEIRQKESNSENNKKSKSIHREAKGILRVEVRLTKKKAILHYTDKTNTSKQIKDLSKKSEMIFIDTFKYIIPCGDYYKLKHALELVEENIAKKKHKEKMIRLLELIPKKKSLYLAVKEMNDRKIKQVLEMFREIGVSPVTISKRHNVKYLKSLYEYLS